LQAVAEVQTRNAAVPCSYAACYGRRSAVKVRELYVPRFQHGGGGVYGGGWLLQCGGRRRPSRQVHIVQAVCGGSAERQMFTERCNKRQAQQQVRRQ